MISIRCRYGQSLWRRGLVNLPATHKGRLLVGLAGAVLMIGIVGGMWGWVTTDPRVVLLLSEGGASWIRFDEPFLLRARIPSEVATEFRTSLRWDGQHPKAMLNFRALKVALVYVDGQLIYSSTRTPQEWKELHQISFPRDLPTGPHELRIVVFNENGHAALLAYSHDLDLLTGREWEARQGPSGWTRALPVNERRAPALSRQFPAAYGVVVDRLPLLIAIFSAVFFATVACERSRALRTYCRRLVPSPASAIRWGLLVAWAALALNNLWKVPTSIGFDIQAHYDYMNYVLQHRTLPSASEGWQMFQAPLYYMVSAALARLFLDLFSLEHTLQLLRLLQFVSGMAQVELCYRALRYVFPGCEKLQSLGVWLGGLLPMNIYMSQYIGNEPFAGCLAALTVVVGIRHLSDPSSVQSAWSQYTLGLILGLAMLAKMTAVLLVLPVMGVVLFAVRAAGGGPAAVAIGCGRVIAAAAVVSGWFYARNWILFGRLFVGGWDSDRGIIWWQDPAYRIVEDFILFGEALIHPIYAAYAGFWNALYSTFWLDGYLSSMVVYEGRPPWNYDFLLSAPWLALLPSAGILIGIAVAVYHPVQSLREKPSHVFSVACVGLYGLALLYLFLLVPIYSTAKATYTLGLIPCYAILCAAGLDPLLRHVLSRAAVYGGMACWGVFAYLAYFVVS